MLIAFPLQQWVHEYAWMFLLYVLYIASLFAAAVGDLASYVVFHSVHLLQMQDSNAILCSVIQRFVLSFYF